MEYDGFGNEERKEGIWIQKFQAFDFLEDLGQRQGSNPPDATLSRV